jgi:hypothetical protein
LGHIESSEGLTRITSEGFGIPMEPGAPFVPVKTLRVLIPANAVGSEIAVSVMESTYLRTGPISSVPEQVPIGSDPGYIQSVPYHRNMVDHIEILSEGVQRGFRVLDLRFNPVIPSEGGVEISTHLFVTVLIDTDGHSGASGDELPVSLAGSVLNPYDAKSFGSMAMIPSGILPSGTFDYVVVTDPTKVGSAFDDLVEWKTIKGVPATVFTTAHIYANYSGRDDQEKVRNFLKDALATWDIKYALIGGDTAVVPYRGLYCSAGDEAENDIASDLYYSALDGTFNSDNDTVFGETSDNVDVYYDIIVGRAPVQTETEANNFVDGVSQQGPLRRRVPGQLYELIHRIGLYQGHPAG